MTQALEPFLRDNVAAGEPRLPAGPTPATAHVIAMTELSHPRNGELDPTHGASRSQASLVHALGDPESPLRHVKAKLTVCVGTAELTVGELLGATEQQVIRLDRSVDDPVEILLEGHVVARGTLVAVDDQFAVRITELPVRFDAPLHAAR